MIRAGFHVADITPPVGASIPGGFAPRPAEGIHDPLRVRAAALLGEDAALAVVGVDAVSISHDDNLRARKSAARLTPIPTDAIIIGASHTHSGGPANSVLGVEGDEHYREQIVRQIASAVAEATRTALPAELAWARGCVDGLAWNRRWVLADGSHETHADPARPEVLRRAGPSDPELLLLAVRDLDGRILGFVGNFTCHPTIMGGGELSADYPGAWSDLMERVTGAPLVFLNGAMGDVTQVNRELDAPQRGPEGVTRFARALTGEALKLLADMRFEADPPLKVASEVLRIPLREPDPAQLEADRATVAGAAADDFSREVVFARERLLLRAYIDRVGADRCEVICARIGDLGLATGPGQMFCEFGLDCKVRSPCAHTMYVSLANGNAGYVPTPEALAKGGYEPTLCRGSRLAPEAGGLIVDAQVKLLERLA